MMVLKRPGRNLQVPLTISVPFLLLYTCHHIKLTSFLTRLLLARSDCMCRFGLSSLRECSPMLQAGETDRGDGIGGGPLSRWAG